MVARATLSKVNHVNPRFMWISLTFLLASRDDDARQQDRAPREVQSSSKARNCCLFLDLPLNAVLCRPRQPELQSHNRLSFRRFECPNLSREHRQPKARLGIGWIPGKRLRPTSSET